MFWVRWGKSVFFLSEIYFWCMGMLWLAKSNTEHERALIESKVQAFLDEMNWAATMHQADVFSKQLQAPSPFHSHQGPHPLLAPEGLLIEVADPCRISHDAAERVVHIQVAEHPCPFLTFRL